MFRRELLAIVRPRTSDTEGLVYAGGIDYDDMIVGGKVRSPTSGETYEVKNGYLDLLKGRVGADNVANLTNFLPGAGPAYEPLWRVHSLDLGCSAGLYTRSLARMLDYRGEVVGIDISPFMLKEAARRAQKIGAKPSFVRADAHNIPFADANFSGAVCGGTLNELGDPARALRETRRILEPGGHLAIMGILRARTPRGRLLQRLLSIGGVRFFDPDELKSLLDHAGFDPDPLQTHDLIFFAAATRRG